MAKVPKRKIATKGKKTSQKSSKKSNVSSDVNQFQLHPAHCEKISSLHPALFDAVHRILREHGVDAEVHTMSFRPPGTGVTLRADAGCCFVNGVWTCPCPWV
jgi:hypothetical protein